MAMKIVILSNNYPNNVNENYITIKNNNDIKKRL